MKSFTNIKALGTVSDTEMRDNPLLMHHCFERWAQLLADSEAVLSGHQTLTYEQVNSRANQLAHYLQSKGVQVGQHVAIWLEPGIERIVSLLAVLKTGAVVCPMHPTLPLALMDDILSRISSPFILTTQTHLQNANALDAKQKPKALSKTQWLVVDSLSDTLAQQASSNLSVDIHPLSHAYVIHTSGSTGIPKPVAMTHRAFSYEIRWQVQQSRNYQPLRTAQIASLGFDVFLTEVMSSLGNGGSLVPIPEAARTDGAALLALINEHQIQRMLTSRIVLQGLAEEVAKGAALPLSLQEVMCTGEQLVITPEIRQLFSQIQCRLYNEYGMSENPVVTTYELTGLPETWPERPPAGIVSRDTELLILDEKMQPVTQGEVGELYIGGEYLAVGYLNDEEKTAEVFVDHPFGEGKLLRSHDIGQMDAHGVITLLGRNDRVVKIHGVRIGLGEIESAMNQVNGVKESIVVKDDDSEHDRLIGYLVMHDNQKKSDTQLRKHLSAVLPAHAIPAVFLQLDNIPLTHSGKVDRKALPKPSNERPDIDTEFVAASDDIQQQLVRLWSAALGLLKIGVNDNLYDLGGDSISAAKLIESINQAWSLNLDTTSIYQYPTVSTLAKHLRAHLGLSQENEGVQPSALGVRADVIASRRQRRRQAFRQG
ncbi:non-ribosomal peptide synthetase [Alteromonas sp. a30]|uniref:non-ribosomal peptide synthetase n=1 Tax=Alteromonas sp. a30 TaxID=2730917 RepID=UPI00227EB4B4|nr:non-ribosomal peptide synthetase [Alteromonas sp. a30]MCY7296752.1 non-ribosomal peptide synthetase [Alteromonas sp. a30]